MILRRLAPAIILASLTLAAPTAHAATPGATLAADAVPEVLDPGNVTRVPLIFVAPCRDLAPGTSVATFEASAEVDWLRVRVEPARVDVDASACPDGDARAATVLLVEPGNFAPADSPAGVRVVARAGNASADWARVVAVPFVARVSVEPEHRSMLGKPQEVLDVPVRVTSHSNGPAKVRFAIVESTNGFNAPAPAPLTVEAAVDDGGVTRTTWLSIVTPFHNGQVSAQGTVRVRWTAAYALDEGGGNVTGEFTVRPSAEGVYVPAPAVPLALLAVAGAAARLKRETPRPQRS